jgi:phosphatidylserine/phosphatidylglycerophosphate/cardiolipin synthase-like enzyme
MTSGAHTDHRLSRRAGQRDYHDLLNAGVELLEYGRTLLHNRR